MSKQKKDARQKTLDLGRVFLKIADLELNELNPNEMSDAEFNMLCDNVERMGITDPILVRPKGNGKYRIIGGAHRYEVAKLYGFEDAPCTVVDDPDFDEDQEKFQIVRMNVIRGKMSPNKFMKLYQSLSQKYADEVMADSFGFAEAEQFDKLVNQMSKSLPADMQAEFKKAASELKTIDGLSNLLNQMFTKYGSTLPYGYMLIDFGGRESIWLRMSGATKKALLVVGKRCMDEQRSVDDIVGGLIGLAAAGKLEDQFVQLIAKTQPVQIDGSVVFPTLDALDHGAHASIHTNQQEAAKA